jgi:hypothetical protein
MNLGRSGYSRRGKWRMVEMILSFTHHSTDVPEKAFAAVERRSPTRGKTQQESSRTNCNQGGSDARTGFLCRCVTFQPEQLLWRHVAPQRTGDADRSSTVAGALPNLRQAGLLLGQLRQLSRLHRNRATVTDEISTEHARYAGPALTTAATVTIALSIKSTSRLERSCVSRHTNRMCALHQNL